MLNCSLTLWKVTVKHSCEMKSSNPGATKALFITEITNNIVKINFFGT